jgi:uracil-DNA glycosylase
MIGLRGFLSSEIKKKKIIYPPGDEIFSSFNETPFKKVKVVIIGQDPYHGPDQAHGMSFSVKPGIKSPPSLVNIYKEIESDLGITRPDHGFLLDWAKQGVLLLNAVLTVERSMPASHRGKGWEIFTDRVIEILNAKRENLVFLLWGAFAQSKASMLDEDRHLILKAPHPSPFSAHKGFLGCKHFSKANKYLKDHGISEIDWKLKTLD